jgi:hypothetical protein
MRVVFAIPALFSLMAAAGAAPAPSKSEPVCVDVQIGADRAAALECLNQAFKKAVAREHAPPPEAPIDTRSSPVAVGIANETVARQRMGNSFGVSSIPQRPVEVFVPSLPVPPSR